MEGSAAQEALARTEADLEGFRARDGKGMLKTGARLIQLLKPAKSREV